jgi:hypothetical protein
LKRFKVSTTQSIVKLSGRVDNPATINLGYYCETSTKSPLPFDYADYTIVPPSKHTSQKPVKKPAVFNFDDEDDEDLKKALELSKQDQVLGTSDSNYIYQIDDVFMDDTSLSEHTIDTPEDLPTEPPAINALYSLHSIVWHRGSADFGHYMAEVFDVTQGKWIHCDDEVMEEEQEERSLSRTRDNYLMFYVHENCWPKYSKPS